MNNDQSLETTTTIMMTVDEGKSNRILDSGSAYHLYGDKQMFFTYVARDGGLVQMANNTPSRVIGQ